MITDNPGTIFAGAIGNPILAILLVLVIVALCFAARKGWL